MDFNIISHKCWVWQNLKQVRLPGSWAQGQGHWLFVEKHCHCSCTYSYWWILMWDHTKVGWYEFNRCFLYPCIQIIITCFIILRWVARSNWIRFQTTLDLNPLHELRYNILQQYFSSLETLPQNLWDFYPTRWHELGSCLITSSSAMEALGSPSISWAPMGGGHAYRILKTSVCQWQVKRQYTFVRLSENHFIFSQDFWLFVHFFHFCLCFFLILCFFFLRVYILWNTEKKH